MTKVIEIFESLMGRQIVPELNNISQLFKRVLTFDANCNEREPMVESQLLPNLSGLLNDITQQMYARFDTELFTSRPEADRLRECISSGKIVIVHGPCGCGKTTLIRRMQQELLEKANSLVFHRKIREIEPELWKALKGCLHKLCTLDHFAFVGRLSDDEVKKLQILKQKDGNLLPFNTTEQIALAATLDQQRSSSIPLPILIDFPVISRAYAAISLEKQKEKRKLKLLKFLGEQIWAFIQSHHFDAPEFDLVRLRILPSLRPIGADLQRTFGLKTSADLTMIHIADSSVSKDIKARDLEIVNLPIENQYIEEQIQCLMEYCKEYLRFAPILIMDSLDRAPHGCLNDIYQAGMALRNASRDPVYQVFRTATIRLEEEQYARGEGVREVVPISDWENSVDLIESQREKTFDDENQPVDITIPEALEGSLSVIIRKILTKRLQFLENSQEAQAFINNELNKLKIRGLASSLSLNQLSQRLILATDQIAWFLSDMAAFRNFNVRVIMLDLYYLLVETLFNRSSLSFLNSDFIYRLGHPEGQVNLDDHRIVKNLVFRWFSIRVEESRGGKITLSPLVNVLNEEPFIDLEKPHHFLPLKILALLRFFNKPLEVCFIESYLEPFGFDQDSVRSTLLYLIQNTAEFDSVGLIFSVDHNLKHFEKNIQKTKLFPNEFSSSNQEDPQDIENKMNHPIIDDQNTAVKIHCEITPKGIYFLKRLATSFEYIFWLAMTSDFSNVDWFDRVLKDENVPQIQKGRLRTWTTKFETHIPLEDWITPAALWTIPSQKPEFNKEFKIPCSISKARLKINFSTQTWQFCGRMTEKQKFDLIRALSEVGVSAREAKQTVNQLFIDSQDFVISFEEDTKTVSLNHNILNNYEEIRNEGNRLIESPEDKLTWERLINKAMWPGADLMDDLFRIPVVLEFLNSVIIPLTQKDKANCRGKPVPQAPEWKYGRPIDAYRRLFEIEGYLYAENCLRSVRAYISDRRTRISRSIKDKWLEQISDHLDNLQKI